MKTIQIGIYTIIRSESPGASYQAFALYHALNKLEYNAFFLSGYEYGNYIVDRKRLDKIIKHRHRGKKYLLDTILYIERHFPFYLETYPFNDCKSCSPDIMVIGSDQVFNINMCKDGCFLLDFNRPKYSFASSFGGYIVDDSFDLSLFNGFKGISIREYNDVNKLRSLGLNVRHDLDPTFILTKEEWCEQIKNVKRIKKKYVLVFGTTRDDVTLKFAKSLAKEKGYKVILANYWGNKLYLGTKIVNRDNCMDLLGLIRDAQCVVTHSFHGFAMAINFNVNVYYALFDNSKGNDRFTTVVDVLHLDNHNILDNNMVYSEYNYDDINKILEERRKDSFEYLSSFKDYAKM